MVNQPVKQHIFEVFDFPSQPLNLTNYTCIPNYAIIEDIICAHSTYTYRMYHKDTTFIFNVNAMNAILHIIYIYTNTSQNQDLFQLTTKQLI